jgi:hypothetical protein
MRRRLKVRIAPDAVPAAKRKFLEGLARGWSIERSAIRANIARPTVFLWRKEDEAFARAWAEAYEAGTDALEDVVLERATAGSDTLAMFLLKARRPAKYRENQPASRVEIEFTFRRDASAFSGHTIEAAPSPPEDARATIDALPPEIAAHMALVMEGVPAERWRETFDRALPLVRAAHERGTGEQVEAGMATPVAPEPAPDVAAAADGFGVNLDDPPDTPGPTVEEVAARVAAHNARVRARSRS